MENYLRVLEDAITDVGHWTWWTASLPSLFQVEFSGTQLWSPPRRDGGPPSGQIALCFSKPRLVYFLSMSDSVLDDWPDRLQRDELEPVNLSDETFTLTNPEYVVSLITKAVSIRALVGELHGTPAVGEAILGIDAGDFGLAVAAESMAVFNHLGELSQEAVLESNGKWWQYWREYWRLRDTPNALPQDYACEVTIPTAP